MKASNRSNLAALCAAVLCGMAWAAPAPLHLYTEDFPPANFIAPDGKLRGLALDKVVALFQDASLAYTLEVVPWERAFRTAQTERSSCVFSTTRLPEREKLFRWVGPLATVKWWIYGRDDDNRPIQKLLDLRPYTIGVYHGDALDTFFRSRGFKVDAALQDEANPRKLAAGRIDYWATWQILDTHPLLTESGVKNIRPLFLIATYQMYLACNPGVPGASIDALEAAYKRLKDKGILTEIDQAYADFYKKP